SVEGGGDGTAIEFGVYHGLNLSDVGGVCTYTYHPRLDDEVNGACGACAASDHVCTHNSAYQGLCWYGDAGAEGARFRDNACPSERVGVRRFARVIDARWFLVGASDCHHAPIGGEGNPSESDAVIVLDVDLGHAAAA